jgi:hypothetical protein
MIPPLRNYWEGINKTVKYREGWAVDDFGFRYSVGNHRCRLVISQRVP